MKKIVVFLMLITVSSGVFAGTSYLDLGGAPVHRFLDSDYVPYPLSYKSGEVGAQALRNWESKNPDKRIVSVTTNSVYCKTGGTLLLGFWIVWESREVAKKDPVKK